MQRATLSATLAALVTLLAASTAAAQVDADMYNAQRNLEAAWDRLQASPYDYNGHRRKALEHVGRALEELHRAAFTYPPGTEEKGQLKQDKRELKQHQKEEKRAEKLEQKALEREEDLEERGH
jgi:Skp family chaperone for outer membrane proteins